MFTKIQTIGVLPDGRVIHREISDPRGIGWEEHDRISSANFKAFPKSSATCAEKG